MGPTEYLFIVIAGALVAAAILFPLALLIRRVRQYQQNAPWLAYQTDADPLMEAAALDNRSEPALKGKNETGSQDFVPYDDVPGLFLKYDLPQGHLIESGFINGPVSFSDLEPSIQSELFKLEEQTTIFGARARAFMYGSQELTASEKLIFVYMAYSSGLQGFCFIED